MREQDPARAASVQAAPLCVTKFVFAAAASDRWPSQIPSTPFSKSSGYPLGAAFTLALVSDPESTLGLNQFLFLAHGLNCFCSFHEGRFIEEGKQRCETVAIDQTIDLDIFLRGDAPPCDVENPTWVPIYREPLLTSSRRDGSPRIQDLANPSREQGDEISAGLANPRAGRRGKAPAERRGCRFAHSFLTAFATPAGPSLKVASRSINSAGRSACAAACRSRSARVGS